MKRLRQGPSGSSSISPMLGQRTDILRLAEERIGGQWTGVRFHHAELPVGTLVGKKMRVCEAIDRSFDDTIILPAEQVCCPGARRVLALTDTDDTLAHEISTETGIDFDTAYQVVRETPRLGTPITAITLGCEEPCDVILGYVQSQAVMKLVRQWQQIYGTGLGVRISTFMAVCGAVLVGSHQAQRICLSFGCPASRKYGGVERDTVVAGLPWFLLNFLLQEEYHNANV